MSKVVAHTIQPGDAGYPRRLDVLCAARPTLHVLGTIADPSGSALSVAIVGARAASAEAASAAHALAAHVASMGGMVVSGGAIGVDTAAHRGALAAQGATAVVLGSGLDIIYPDRNRDLFAAVIDRGGALISMFPAGTQPHPGNFVRRNAIIAALADVTVVIAGTARSGALHTARAAARFGRTVAAMPGTPLTTSLLAAGAAVVESPGDLEHLLAGRPRAVERRSLDERQRRAWDALDPIDPRGAGDVAAACHLRIGAAVAILSELEAAGWVVPAPGATYLRSQATP